MTDSQFFWYMFVNALVALGTIGAVIVALFHDYFKLAPQICLRLLSDRGEKVRFGDGVEGRFYHLQVENNRRWSVATSTGLHLVRLERRGPGEEWVTEWAGDVLIRCRDQELYPLLRDIGSPIDYDILSVRAPTALGAPGEVRLYPILSPANLEVVRSGRSEFVASFQAKSSEADSSIVRIRVSWDGAWESGDSDMQTHMEIKHLQ